MDFCLRFHPREQKSWTLRSSPVGTCSVLVYAFCKPGVCRFEQLHVDKK